MFALPAWPNQTIDVGLFHQQEPRGVWVSSQSGVRVLDHRTGRAIGEQSAPGSGADLSIVAEPSAFLLGGDLGDLVASRRIRADALRVAPRVPDEPLRIATDLATGVRRSYPGTLLIQRRDGRLRLVNRVPLESYVAMVLAAEAPQKWRPEALRAVAVCIRTYALANAGRHRADGFDVCSYAHCQAYQGLGRTRPAAFEAADNTAALILTHGGEPIEALHHACCGGRTTANERAWPGADPLSYLRGGWDAHDGQAFCREAPEFEWTSDIPAAKLLDTLRRDTATDPGAHLTAIKVLSRDDSDRVQRLELHGEGRHALTGRQLWAVVRHHLGWHALPSTLFWVEKRGNAFHFRGRGFGHGVGLCQWGGQGRALAGQTFDEILAHYYPGTKLQRSPPGRR